VKYDGASWHKGGDFPAGQPEEYGGTHIALFLKWCFVQGWAGDMHVQGEPEAVAAVVDGSLSATDFFFEYCDGKLVDDMLSDDGNGFTSQCYGEKGLYLEDYAKHFGELMYLAPNQRTTLRSFRQ